MGAHMFALREHAVLYTEGMETLMADIFGGICLKSQFCAVVTWCLKKATGLVKLVSNKRGLFLFC